VEQGPEVLHAAALEAEEREPRHPSRTSQLIAAFK
jgi:hypothetical protein